MNECNCGNPGCGCEFGTDYNAWGNIGVYLPLTYQIYYGGKSEKIESSGTTTDPDAGDDSEKIRVEGDTLIIPSNFEVVYVSGDTLIIQNDTVTVSDSTLNFVN